MPTDHLQDDRRKRDLERTSEPSGSATQPQPPSRSTSSKKFSTQQEAPSLSFVVQKHAARTLHYDFRLELEGSLKSWAVPKGPSLDPHDKRLAIHVEDHPLAYADFEGVIPAGQYGAGTVIIWDRGIWTPTGDPLAGYRAGKLKFALQGDKLNGQWTLVRMRDRGDHKEAPWLLIKEHDEAARPAAEFNITQALPDSVSAPKALPTSSQPLAQDH